MKDSKDLLNSILKTAQMGQIGIRSVLKSPVSNHMKTVLKNHLQTYHNIEQCAIELGNDKNWELNELNPAVERMTDMMTRLRLSTHTNMSKTAAMMIRGNTRGMIKGYQKLNQCYCSDERISELGRQLLQKEEQAIHQLQGFL